MSGNEKISPNNTYVLDEALLDEMDSIELTGLLSELSELSEQLAGDDDAESTRADEQVDADSADADSGNDNPGDDNEPLTLELEVDDIEIP